MKYKATANQMLLFDKNKTFRDNTIDMALKFNCHLDNGILLKAINKEIERNEGLRIKVSKHFRTWNNEICPPYQINEIKTFDICGKSKQEQEKTIDDLCSKLIDSSKAVYPFEFYQLIGDDCDYVLFRVLHTRMDAYATMLTLTDIIKVYFGFINNNEVEPLASVENYLKNYNDNIEKINNKIKDDNKYFADINDALGEPTFLGIEGGYDGSKKRYPFNFLKNHPCRYYRTNLNNELANKIFDFCKEQSINIVSLFLSLLEMYTSAVNYNNKDVSLFYTSNLRAKLSEKKLPFTTATAIFFRRILDLDMSFKDFLKACNSDYLISLKHYGMDISAIYKYLILLNLSKPLARYEQVSFCYIPVDLSGINENIDIEPYWPKSREASDFIIYIISILNKDGSFSLFYRYFEDVLKEEHIKKLHNGIVKMLKYGLEHQDERVSDIMKMVEGEQNARRITRTR